MLRNAIHYQAKIAAQQSAVRLMAYTDSVWPDGPMLDTVVEQILNDAVVFAVNARRILNSLGLTNVVQQSDWTPAAGETLTVETDLRKCLNAIIHAHKLQVRISNTIRIKFSDRPNVQAHGLLASTDRFSNVHIDLFGVAWSFLNLPSK